jgi:hemerythrin-like domain-containing protein
MKPIGPLMVEHRLIDRMISIVKEEVKNIDKGKKADPLFIDTYVDFARTYADRCHHGKEEDILFRDLAKKQLKAEEKQIMDELIQEHISARKLVGRLSEASSSYEKGSPQSCQLPPALIHSSPHPLTHPVS